MTAVANVPTARMMGYRGGLVVTRDTSGRQSGQRVRSEAVGGVGSMAVRAANKGGAGAALDAA